MAGAVCAVGDGPNFEGMPVLLRLRGAESHVRPKVA